MGELVSSKKLTPFPSPPNKRSRNGGFGLHEGQTKFSPKSRSNRFESLSELVEDREVREFFMLRNAALRALGEFEKAFLAKVECLGYQR